jgi:methionyl-tRNA synthetase
MSKAFYATTPIYYVNDVPHIGHAYTSILGDVLCRFHRMWGEEVFFLTGTDEHGQKVQEAAQKAGLEPKEHCDKTSARFKALAELLGLSNDRFIRTTDSDHMSFVQSVLQGLWDKGEIYKDSYKGLYNVRDERFYSENDIREGRGPAEGEPVEEVEEVNYFFKMSAYQEKLLKHIEENPDWIVPDYRKNEVLGFLRQPLGDLCISRPKRRLTWGIELPFDKDYVTYVWFDALLNYVSGVNDKSRQNGEAWWPASVHLIGKDILTTHAVYWPSMLMGAGIPLPKQILAHGWWMADGQKMSKSLGNVVDPFQVVEKFQVVGGKDAFRFFLMREMVVGADGSYSDAALQARVDTDLANDVGNVLSRIRKQVQTAFAGKIPARPATLSPRAQYLREAADNALERVRTLVEGYRVSVALEETFAYAKAINRYLEDTQPWHLAKDPAKRDELAEVLSVSAEALRLLLTLLWPVIPTKAEEGLATMGLGTPVPSDLAWGVLGGDVEFKDGPSLFPRLQTKVEKPAAAPVVEASHALGRVDLRVGQILSCEPHPTAEKLWVLKVSLGTAGERQVCAGLKEHFTAEQLVDRKVLLVANLKAAKLRGVESQGMVLAADNADGSVHLIAPEGNPGDQATREGIVFVPTKSIKLDDLDGCPLEIHGNQLCHEGVALTAGGLAVNCPAEEGAKVH